jgi:DUF1009 family protein
MMGNEKEEGRKESLLERAVSLLERNGFHVFSATEEADFINFENGVLNLRVTPKSESLLSDRKA